MPSFLGRFFGVSFRTERLIMNIIGLVNSTLDWHPLKWTNKLEQIWNLSLSQQTIILETIGEERIKSVLSYIVIARILIAHVFTLSYMTNFYPMVTWSRPNLLLPWLVLSFFKNVVLEVIVIAVGLLFWYDKRFSLPIFLEFVFVKVVPLLFATYNWYSNSCLYLELRRIEKMRKLRRNMRSDSNLMVSRLYLKLAETRYRTRSMTTLISWESYDTSDTNDTISRIIEDANLSPGEKVMRILRLNEQDIEDARGRVREREMHRRLTEEEDETFSTTPRNISRYFSMVSQYELGTRTLFFPRDESRKEQAEREKNDRDGSTKKGIEERTEDDAAGNLEEKKGEVASDDSSPPSQTNDPKETINDTARDLPNTPETSPKTASKETSHPAQAAELSPDLKTEQTNQQPSSPNSKPNDSSSTHESSKLDDVADVKPGEDVGKSSTKLQQLFSCNCTGDDSLLERGLDECSLFDEVAMRTSTPKGSPEKQRDASEPSEDSKSSSNRSASNFRDEIDGKTNLRMEVDGFPVEKLLRNDLDVLKSTGKDCKSERDVLVDAVDKVAEGLSRFRREDGLDEEKLSKIVKDFSVAGGMAENLGMLETAEAGESFGRAKIGSRAEGSGLASVECAVRDGANFVRTSTLSARNQSIDGDFLNIHLPEYSFGDANIPRFYKDSMKIFDGCYEKDFANNSELQCLLKQLEKKKWSLFPGQAGREFLLPSNILIANDRFAMQDLRTAYHLASDFDNFGRHEIPLSASSRPTHERGIPRILRSTKETQHHSPIPTPNRDVSTQTSFETRTKLPPAALADAKKRGRSSLKRKRPKDDVKIRSKACPLIRGRRTESQTSLHPRVSPRRKPSRPLNTRKKPLGTSASDKSVCECKLPQADSERPAQRKHDARPRRAVENLGTVPLSRVAKASLFDAMLHGSKPPVCPKKTRREPSTQSGSARKATASIGRLLEASRKEVQPAASSRKLKSRGRGESLEEQEAKEMRALKVYNEITLLRDKRELEARKGTPPGSSESWKRRRSKRDSPRVRTDEDYVGKENSCADATTEPLIRDEDRVARDKIVSVSTEKYPCAKLSKVNRITDRLLENFDRLHGGQARQDSRRSRLVETDARKQYSKYSRPRKFVEEESVSIASFKKVEGTQMGRELERVRGRKDVRTATTSREAGRDLERQDYRCGTPSTSAGGGKLEGRDGNSFMTIKSTVMLDVVGSWSSSTVDQGEDGLLTEQDSPNVPSHSPEAFPKIHTETIKEEPPFPQTFNNETPSTSSSDLPMNEGTNLPLRPTSPKQRSLGTPRASLQLLSPRPSNTSADFLRNVEVSRTYNTVVLGNPSAPKDQKPQRRNIVDDDTIRMIHHAFSDRSIDFILDLSGEILSVNNVLNSGQLRMDSEEFTFQPNRETMGIPMEELPPLPHEQQSFRRQILATICRLQSPEQDVQEAGSCPIASPILPATQEIDEDEEIYPVAGHEIEIDEVLSSVIGLLRCLNGEEFSLGRISGVGYEILQDMFEEEEDELEFDEEDEEESEEAGKLSAGVEGLLRFVQEDVCTDISFPILIAWADLATVLDAPSDVQEDLDVNLARMEPSKVNFFCLEDAEEMTIVSDGAFEDCGEGGTRIDLDSSAMDQLPLEASFYDPFANLDNLGILEDEWIGDSTGSLEEEDPRLVEHSQDRTRTSSGMEELFKDVSRDNLNRTYELSRAPGEDCEEEEEEEYAEEDCEVEEEEEYAEEDAPGILQGTTRTLDHEVKEEEYAEEDAPGILQGTTRTLDHEVKEEENAEEDAPGILQGTTRTLDHEVKEEEYAEEDAPGILQGTTRTLDHEVKEEEYAEEDAPGILQGTTRTLQAKSWSRMEDIARRIESFKDELGTMRSPGKQQSTMKEEDFQQDPEGSNERPASPSTVEGRSELDRRITLTIVLTFWLAVFYFYLRYFYEKIFSFGRVSQASLRPFEIHAVPTSTTTLLGLSRLARRMEYSIDENEEEADALEAIVDLEDNLSSIGSALNLESTSSVSQSNDGTVSVGRFSSIESEVERTMLFLSERVTENVKILPFFDEQPIVDSRTLLSDSASQFVSLRSQSNPPGESSDTGSKFVDGSFVSQRGGQLELSLAAREIETLRYDDDETKLASGFDCAELRLEEAEGTSVATAETLSDDSREETCSFSYSIDGARRQRHLDASEETARDEETDNLAESAGRDCEGRGEVAEEKMDGSSSQAPNVYAPSTDSFDSNYTGTSDGSKSASAGDLNASSMEEFAD